MSNLRPSRHKAFTGAQETPPGQSKVTVRGRVSLATKDTILRAVELGIYLTESDLVEHALARFVREELEPALMTGAYDTTRQSQRRMASLAASATQGPTPGEAAAELIKGAERQFSLDPALAIEYTSQVESELTERRTAWDRRVLLVLNGSTAWIRARGGE